MAFHKITVNEEYRFATVHNYGCTFRCPVCSYKLRSGANGRPGCSWPKPERFLTLDACKSALQSLDIERVNFMGGEPTTASDLDPLLSYCKQTLGVETWLGHTNGHRLPIANLDGANVGLKAWDNDIHRYYTGRDKEPVFRNFAAAHAAGLNLRANVVLIPGLVDSDQVLAIAQWIAGLSVDIPFHIMGYIPVPGQPYPAPSEEQMMELAAACRRILRTIDCSLRTREQILTLNRRDPRFNVRQVL